MTSIVEHAMKVTDQERTPQIDPQDQVRRAELREKLYQVARAQLIADFGPEAETFDLQAHKVYYIDFRGVRLLSEFLYTVQGPWRVQLLVRIKQRELDRKTQEFKPYEPTSYSFVYRTAILERPISRIQAAKILSW